MGRMSYYDRLDAPSIDTQERIRAHEAIVRELAEQGPFLVDAGVCLQCEATGLIAWGRTEDLDTHEPGCLWRRAKALYPGGGEP